MKIIKTFEDYIHNVNESSDKFIKWNNASENKIRWGSSEVELRDGNIGIIHGVRRENRPTGKVEMYQVKLDGGETRHIEGIDILKIKY